MTTPHLRPVPDPIDPDPDVTPASTTSPGVLLHLGGTIAEQIAQRFWIAERGGRLVRTIATAPIELNEDDTLALAHALTDALDQWAPVNAERNKP